MFDASFVATTFSYEIFVYPRGDTLKEILIRNISLKKIEKAYKLPN